MLLVIAILANYSAAEFTEALTDYVESNAKWYSAGLLFEWPKHLGLYVKKIVEGRENP